MLIPKNIMIVEDEVITQRYLKDILAKYDVNITGCFDTGKDALDALERTSCDLILVDINLKGAMDGLRLSKHILDKYTTCIVFITAYSDNRTLEEALELSPYGFVVKPFSPNEIEVAIQIAYKRYLIYQEKSKKVLAESDNNFIVINEYLKYSLVKTTLFEKDEAIHLSMRQTKLIGLLCQNINNVVPNEIIVEEVWGNKIVRNTSLRTLVYNIRKLVPSLSLISHSKLGYMIKSDFA